MFAEIECWTAWTIKILWFLFLFLASFLTWTFYAVLQPKNVFVFRLIFYPVSINWNLDLRKLNIHKFIKTFDIPCPHDYSLYLMCLIYGDVFIYIVACVKFNSDYVGGFRRTYLLFISSFLFITATKDAHTKTNVHQCLNGYLSQLTWFLESYALNETLPATMSMPIFEAIEFY